MSPGVSKRKRFSAFDDFPVDPSATQEKVIPAAETTSNLPKQQDKVERIERLKPSQMIPDRFQPRRLLPASIREQFFSGQIDCYQAARRWIALTRQDGGHQAQIDRLLAMGASFADHGQIKPITGLWVATKEGAYIFLIETGERRFWAACLLVASGKLENEPLLRVEIVASPSRYRQVLENRHAELPSAVSQACEIASLILAELEITPANPLQDEYDYFRMARSQRMPAGLWEKIVPIMQLTRPRMVQLLNILQFPTPALELADRYRLPERVLREILALPSDQWERLIMLGIQNHLTSDEVVEFSAGSQHRGNTKKKGDNSTRKAPSQIAVSGLRRFANTLQRLDEVNRSQALDELADDLVVAGEAERILALLAELSNLVKVRLPSRPGGDRSG